MVFHCGMQYHVGGARWICGDTVTGSVTFSARWSGCPAGANVRLIANGRLLEQLPAGLEGTHEWCMGPEQAGWVLVEIRGDSAEMLAITNPIYLA